MSSGLPARFSAHPALHRAWPAVPIGLLVLVGLLPVVLAMSDLLREPAQAWAALMDPVLWPRMGTSLLIALLTLAVILPSGLVVGWLLARTNLPGRSLWMMLIPLPLFLPPLVHVLSWFGVVPVTGIPAIVLVNVIAFLPFVILTSARSLEQVGRAHAETIQLMGAGGRSSSTTSGTPSPPG